MTMTGQEANDLVEAIHSKLDRTEWDSDTTTEIAELLDAYGLEVRPPRNLHEWTAGGVTYLAEHIGDDGDTRIAVWEMENGYMTGVQYIRENYNIDRDDRSGSFVLRQHGGFSLEQRLDKGIEEYERIRA